MFNALRIFIVYLSCFDVDNLLARGHFPHKTILPVNQVFLYIRPTGFSIDLKKVVLPYQDIYLPSNPIEF